MMLRTPSAWAPSSSDSSAIRFRSRVVQWTRHSRSRSCWIPNATDRALIRTRAIAESETLTRSTPASRRSRAASIVRSIRMLRGGSISTETTNRPASSSSARRVGGGGRRRRRRRPFDERRPRSQSATATCGRSAAVAADGGRTGRQDRVERGPHRGDVLGRRPAAATDDPGPGRQQPRRHRAEVLGAGGVDEAALEPLRQPGVRHDRARGLAIGRAAHRLERVEAGHRPGSAVDPDRVRAGRGQRLGGGGRAAAVGQDELLAERQRGDDRHVRGAARLVDGQDELVRGPRTSRGRSRPLPPSSRPSICSRNAARIVPRSSPACRAPATRAVRPSRRPARRAR